MCLVKTLKRLILLFAGFALPFHVVSAQENLSEAQKVMRTAFESLSYLVDVALDEDIESYADKKFIAELEKLGSAAAKIGEHTASQSYSFDLVARSLESNVDQLVNNYKAGFNSIGEVYLVETIDHCAACHAQSPEIAGSMNIDEFVERIEQEDVDTNLAAQLLVAVRKFSEALDLWERRLDNKDFSLRTVGSEEAVLEYLSEIVHLDADRQRAIELLNRLGAKPDTPYYLQRKIGFWKKQLLLVSEVEKKPLKLESIEAASEQCRKIEGLSLREDYPVCNFIVSGLSGRMLREQQSQSGAIDAEMFLNMGVARMKTGLPSGYVPQIEHYLEAAILAAPGSDTAKTAYSHLEELSYFLYGDLELADDVMEVSIDGLREVAEIN